MEHGLTDNMTAKDMFVRQHLAILREAITRMSADKYGLALNINAIIMRTIKVLTGIFSEAMFDDKVGWLVY